eukprot:3798605-Prymnesium_polylepis.1
MASLRVCHVPTGAFLHRPFFDRSQVADNAWSSRRRVRRSILPRSRRAGGRRGVHHRAYRRVGALRGRHAATT